MPREFRRNSKSAHDRRNWRRARALIYAQWEGTEIGDVIRDLVEISTLHGIGTDEEEERLLKMAERYALYAAQAWLADDYPLSFVLSDLREFRKTGTLPEGIDF